MATMQQLAQAMRAADAQGDAQAAQRFATLLRDAQTNQASQKRDADFAAMLEEQAKEYNPMQAALIGAGKASTDLVRGGQNLWAKFTGDQERQDELAALQSEEAGLYAPLQAESPVATTLGEMAPYLATAPLGGGAVAAGRGALARTAGKEAATGAALSGLTYGEDQGTAAALGGALSGAVPLIGRGASKLGGKAIDAVRGAKSATAAGVPLTPGQRVGSKSAQMVEEALARLPVTGSAFRSVKKGQQKAINRMAAESFGETADELGENVLKRASTRIGGEFDSVVAATGRPYNFSREFVQSAGAMRRQIIEEELDAPVAKRLINRLDTRVKTGGKMTAEEYQRINTRVSKKLASPALDPDERTMLSAFKDSLDDMIEQQMPRKTRERWNTAREQWRNLRTVQKHVQDSNLQGSRLANTLERKQRLAGGSPLQQAAQYGRELNPRLPAQSMSANLLPLAAVAGGAGMAGTDDYSGAGMGLMGAALAPWAYRGAGRALASPLQQAGGRALQGMATPTGVSVGSRLGAMLAPQLVNNDG